MKNISASIDKITNSIEDAISLKSFDTNILPVLMPELKMITKKAGWRFNWKTEFNYKNRVIYKLVIQEDRIIQGMMNIEQMDKYIEMHLIETAPHNYGSGKKYLGVAGNLVAFACKRSFDLGFEGYVAFTAKTELVQHYIDTLGAKLIFKNRMSIATEYAKKLVTSYYKNYFNEK